MVVVRNVDTTPSTIELHPEIENQVEWFINEMIQNYSKKVGETISRVLYNKGNIDITDLTPGDTGVYECIVMWGPEKVRQNITVGVYSLQVTADSPTRYVYESDTMKLVCNSLPLGRLFPTAFRQWQFNYSDVMSPMRTLALNTSIDMIPSVTKSMDGVWGCQVKDINTSRIWDTAWYRVAVQDQPSFIARVYRFMLDHLIVVTVIGSILLAICCICFGYAVYKMKRQEDETDDKFVETRNGWEEAFNKFADKGEVKVNDDDLSEKKYTEKTQEDDDSDEDGENWNEKIKDEITSQHNVDEDGNLKQKAEHDNEHSGTMAVDKKVESKMNESKVKREQGNDHAIADDKIPENDKSITNNRYSGETNINDSTLQRKRWEVKTGRTGSIGLGKSEAQISKNKNSNIGTKWGRSDKRILMSNDEVFRYTKNSRKKCRIKRQKHSVIYPEVSKGQASHWLLKNSPSFKKMNTILQEINIKSNQNKDLQSSLGNSTKFSKAFLDLHITSFQPIMATLFTGTERHSREHFDSESLILRSKSLSCDKDSFSYERLSTLCPIDSELSLNPRNDRNQEQVCGTYNGYPSNSHIKDASLWRSFIAGQASMKSWLYLGRERLKCWTTKRSPRNDHFGVRYTVLPQMDEENFLDDL